MAHHPPFSLGWGSGQTRAGPGMLTRSPSPAALQAALNQDAVDLPEAKTGASAQAPRCCPPLVKTVT